MKIKFLLLFFFCSSSIVLISQNDETNDAFNSAFRALKNGGLVVLLPTHSRSITAMEETLASGDLSDKGRQRLKERLFSTQVTAVRDQQWMIEFFREHYSASNLYFIYDKDWTKLKDSNSSGYFLNDSLEIEQSIKRPNGDYLILRKGKPDPSRYTASEAMIVYDSNGNDLPLNFPSVSGLVASFWQLGTAGEKADLSRHEKAIKKLSRRLKYLVQNYKE